VNVFGLVLAGGQSRRMHSDKSELIWNGRTLLEHSCHRLLESGCEHVLISLNTDAQSACIEKLHQSIIVDQFNHCGPLGGIESALNYCLSSDKEKSFVLLIMPVDMPLMKSIRLTQLIQYCLNDITTADVYYYDAGRFPILLRGAQSIHEILIQLLQDSKSKAVDHKKHFSIKHFLNSLTSKVISADIEYDQTDEFYNCNTAEQWAYLNQLNEPD